LRSAAPKGGLINLVSNQAVPEKLLSANAYLGAEPIARALSAGADVVITGRCVDSAVTLGPLIHHFGWTMDQYDQLAGGSLVGHILECGCQATGGLFTDWQSVPDWAHIGYPIAQVEADGSFTVSKVPGTGGLVSCATVGEQLLYEIGDPGAYLLPDVACDFRQVRMEQVGENQVRVSGARGGPPPATLKVSATAMAGWRCAVHHERREALNLFAREFAAAGTSWSPGTTGAGGGRPAVSPLIVPCAFLMPRVAVAPSLRFVGSPNEETVIVPLDQPATAKAAPLLPDPVDFTWPAGKTRSVKLVNLAWGRSGDKGDLSNIGLIARQPEWLPLLWAQVTEEAVLAWLGHLVKGRADRYHLPGLHAMNLVLHEALDGGGPVSLRIDPLGKGMAQMLLEMPVQVPADWPV